MFNRIPKGVRAVVPRLIRTFHQDTASVYEKSGLPLPAYLRMAQLYQETAQSDQETVPKPWVQAEVLNATDLKVVAAREIKSQQCITVYSGVRVPLMVPSLALEGWMIRQNDYLVLLGQQGVYGGPTSMSSAALGACINDVSLYASSVQHALSQVRMHAYGRYQDFVAAEAQFIARYTQKASAATGHLALNGQVFSERALKPGEEVTLAYGAHFWLRHALKPILWHGNVGRALKAMRITRATNLQFGNLSQSQNEVIKRLQVHYLAIEPLLTKPKVFSPVLAEGYAFCKNLLLGIGSAYFPGLLHEKVAVNIRVNTALTTDALLDKLKVCVKSSNSHKRLCYVQALLNSQPQVVDYAHELSFCTAVVSELVDQQLVVQKEAFFADLLKHKVITLTRTLTT